MKGKGTLAAFKSMHSLLSPGQQEKNGIELQHAKQVLKSTASAPRPLPEPWCPDTQSQREGSTSRGYLLARKGTLPMLKGTLFLSSLRAVSLMVGMASQSLRAGLARGNRQSSQAGTPHPMLLSSSEPLRLSRFPPRPPWGRLGLRPRGECPSPAARPPGSRLPILTCRAGSLALFPSGCLFPGPAPTRLRLQPRLRPLRSQRLGPSAASAAAAAAAAGNRLGAGEASENLRRTAAPKAAAKRRG